MAGNFCNRAIDGSSGVRRSITRFQPDASRNTLCVAVSSGGFPVNQHVTVIAAAGIVQAAVPSLSVNAGLGRGTPGKTVVSRKRVFRQERRHRHLSARNRLELRLRATS